MSELKPCPFCGCSMKISKGKYPNGDDRIEPYGWHDSECPLNHVLWSYYPEDRDTEESITEAWNRRAET